MLFNISSGFFGISKPSYTTMGSKLDNISKNGDFQQYWWECTVERVITEGDRATGEALAEDGTFSDFLR